MAGEQPGPPIKDITPITPTGPIQAERQAKPVEVGSAEDKGELTTNEPLNAQETKVEEQNEEGGPKKIESNPQALADFEGIIGPIGPDASANDVVQLLKEKGGYEDNETLREQVEAALAARDLGEAKITETNKPASEQQKEPNAGGEPETPAGEEQAKTSEGSTQSEATEEITQSEKPLAVIVREMWSGNNGALKMIERAISEGKFRLYPDRRNLAKEMGISETAGQIIDDEHTLRVRVNEAIRKWQMIQKGKKIADGEYEVEKGEKVITNEYVEPILEALKKLADETVPGNGKGPIPSDRANRAKEILDVLEKRKKEDPKGGCYFDTTEEAKKPAETPEQMMVRLEEMRAEAMNFCLRPEFLNDDKLAESALSTSAQLALLYTDKENPRGFIVLNPPELREVMLRQALGAYQEFRRQVAPKGKKPEEAYQDWQTVQNEVGNYPDRESKIKATKEYLEKQINDNKGEWHENLGKLVEEGKLSEAMVAIFSASLVQDEHKIKILKLSPALRKSGMDRFLNQYKQDINILNRAIFGNDEEQAKMKDTLKEVLLKVPLNKWGAALNMLGGMFLITTIGKFDELMNTGVEPEGQRGSPAY